MVILSSDIENKSGAAINAKLTVRTLLASSFCLLRKVREKRFKSAPVWVLPEPPFGVYIVSE